jgi:hypothetical protein
MPAAAAGLALPCASVAKPQEAAQPQQIVREGNTRQKRTGAGDEAGGLSAPAVGDHLPRAVAEEEHDGAEDQKAVESDEVHGHLKVPATTAQVNDDVSRIPSRPTLSMRRPVAGCCDRRMPPGMLTQQGGHDG